MKHIALILGLILPFTLLSCTRAEAQTARQNMEFDSLEEKVAALEAQLGANLRYEKDDDGNERWYDSKGNLIHEKRSYGDEKWYDSKGNLIHEKRSYGYEEWYEYDSNGNEIHEKRSDGYEEWYVYDSNGNEIHEKRSDGYEEWYEYDSNGHKIHYKDSNGDESWYEYDSNGNEIHEKRSDGYEEWYEYDSNGHKIHYKDSNGDEKWYEYENVTDSDYWYHMFVYDSNGRLTFSGYDLEPWGGFGEETSYIYDDTRNLVQTTTDLSGNGCCHEERDYWSNGYIKTSLSSDKHGINHYHLFNKEGKVSLTEHFEDLWGDYGRYCYVEYKNSHPFRIWDVSTQYLDWGLEEPEPPLYSEAFEIHYDKSGKITTVKTWCQEKDINDIKWDGDDLFYAFGGFDDYSEWDGSVISLEKNLEISEDNTITFKQWPPDMGGDVIHEKLLPKTDWEEYFDENGNFIFLKELENEEKHPYLYLRPQKNKH